MSTLEPLQIGVIGAGGMGTRHVENLSRFVRAAQVSAVYDLDGQRAAQAADIAGGAAVLNDPYALIRSPQVQAVLIASPDSTHLEFVLACLQEKKPVLCEKPLAVSAADAERILQAEMAAGQRLVSVGFMRRFDPQHVAVKQLADSGTLGRKIVYKGVHRNAAIPYSVSGKVVLTNSAGHDIDATRWLLGQEIQKVYVRGIRSHSSFSPETQDLLLVQMDLSGDCLATLEVYLAAEYGYEVNAEIVAERGVISTGQPDLALLRAQQTRGNSVPLEWLARFQEAYVAETADWVDSLLNQRRFSGASAWDGFATLCVTDACVQSLNSGQPVAVSLPPQPAFYA
jgi:myo-inositol 2-dehydrogenase/D-chiro-inositol 1-dehydrogenase